MSIKERDSWQLLGQKVAPKWPSAFYAVLHNKSVRRAPEVSATSTFRVTEFDFGGCFSTPQQKAQKPTRVIWAKAAAQTSTHTLHFPCSVHKISSKLFMDAGLQLQPASWSEVVQPGSYKHWGHETRSLSARLLLMQHLPLRADFFLKQAPPPGGGRSVKKVIWVHVCGRCQLLLVTSISPKKYSYRLKINFVNKRNVYSRQNNNS